MIHHHPDPIAQADAPADAYAAVRHAGYVYPDAPADLTAAMMLPVDPDGRHRPLDRSEAPMPRHIVVGSWGFDAADRAAMRTPRVEVHALHVALALMAWTIIAIVGAFIAGRLS